LADGNVELELLSQPCIAQKRELAYPIIRLESPPRAVPSARASEVGSARASEVGTARLSACISRAGRV
jgi:hypothetical protein